MRQLKGVTVTVFSTLNTQTNPSSLAPEFYIADFRSLFYVYSTYLPTYSSVTNPFSYNPVHCFAPYTQRKMSNTICRGPNAVPDPIQYPIPRDKSFAFLPVVNGNGSPLGCWSAASPIPSV